MTTHTTIETGDRADRELKARHRAMWGLGDYPSVATEVIAETGRVLVEATGIGPGDRVLDVAAGNGNASFPAAEAGADVVASDLSPALLAAGRAHDPAGRITWTEADAEALPFDDASFDAVISCVGIMFAPHHRAAADELLRVARPGARIGLLSWTPEGFIGQMFATMKPFVAPPPAGVQPPPLWGDEDHVRALLGDRVTDVRVERRTVRVTQFAEPSDFREYFKTNYGPTIAAYKQQPDAAKAAELDAALDALAERFDVGGGGYLVTEWEYLLVTCRRA
jgi:ubiquinone/menaquinone biosynthesis C-methylase UbiE